MSLVMQISSIPSWLGRLFDPPPLASMSKSQKVGRVFLISVSLVTLSILVAMVMAATIFITQRAPQLMATLFKSDFLLASKMAGIVLLSIAVNSACVFILLQVRRLDRELMSGQPDLNRIPGKSGG